MPHDLDAYLTMLKRDGILCLVGAPIGGIRETQEMLDFCAEKGIASDTEVIPMQGITEAYERMLRSDVKYRFVIDLATL